MDILTTLTAIGGAATGINSVAGLIGRAATFLNDKSLSEGNAAVTVTGFQSRFAGGFFIYTPIIGGFFRMKIKRTLWRAIGASAIIALIGFGVAGCDTGNGTPVLHTVTFNLGGGTWDAELKVQVQDNDTVNPPMVVPTKPGYAFVGWYTAATDGTVFDFGEPITQNTTIYARWLDAASVPGATLAAQLSWLETNAQTGGEYVIQLTGDISSAPNTLAFGTRSFTIILRGVGGMRTVSLSSNGSLFTIGSGVTLVLDNNVTLQGRTDNNNALVQVDAGGTLIMNDGSRVTGNTNASGSAGGVRVAGSLFAMYGGEISNNTSYSFGGGVQITGANAIFRMHGGTISGNTGTLGGGVHNNTSISIFEMRGGTISGNTATAANGGGGIRNFGIFRFSGGTIHGNEAAVAVGLRNMASYGAALSNNADTATAQRGTFNAAGEFTAASNLDTTDFTIHE